MKRFRMAVESHKCGDSSHLFFAAPHESPTGEWVNADVAEELLAALKEMVSAFKLLPTTEDMVSYERDAVNVAEKAIAKANSD